MQNYRKVIYSMKGKEGVVLIGEIIEDIDDIKSICRKDYLENLEREIKLDEIKILSERKENSVKNDSL